MIEIIPNWHPIFVHYTIALVSIAVILTLIGSLTARHQFGQELLVTARWCLWLGAIAAIATVIAGLIAYYTVAHDTPSHIAMTLHRNWAITTFIAILSVTFWSLILWHKKKRHTMLFMLSLLFTFVLVMVTAWHGAEVVYRYGIGVQSMPTRSGVGHQHDHHAH